MRAKRAPQSFSLLGLLMALTACAPSGDRPADDAEAPGAPVSGPEAPVQGVRPGIEVLLADSLHLVRGRRVGLITNHTGIDAQGVPNIDRLMDAPEVELVALYAPEHGIRGEALGGQDIDSEMDPVTGLPVYSLYREKERKPTPEMLEGIDALLFDIQDVGARYYTYLSTMARAMEAAGEAGIPFIVLDRPNPIGGIAVQGNVLDTAFSSFVGLFPVPMRHGMTPGELARLYVGEFGIQTELHVVPLDGWRRGMLFSDTDLPWIRPSRNMPSLESALHYPGICLLDGTVISVGRGTDLAFQVVGAPWLDGEALAAALDASELPGVRIEPVRFTPMDPEYRKFTGEEIGGVRLYYLSSDYDPTLVALTLLREARRMSGDLWRWREGFDRLAGTDRLRLGIEAGMSAESLRAGWGEDLEAFKRTRAPYLIYPE